MGSNKEEKDASIYYLEQHREVKTRTAACFWSVLVSVAGGLILGWWEYEHHPSNTQLWMVPVGLILFATPVFVWFSVVASAICNLKNEDVTRASQPLHPQLSNSVPPKREEQWSNHVDGV